MSKDFSSFAGLGMYESPLFLASHEEESGGRSVPTTPLQVAAPGICLCQSDMKGSVLRLFTATHSSTQFSLAIFIFGSAIKRISECILFVCPSLPVTVFSEVAQSDNTEHASQSVPMVSTSTPGVVVPGAAGTGEERDDVFLEPDTDR